MGFSWVVVLAVARGEFGSWDGIYHSRPPERGVEGLKAPNMLVDLLVLCGSAGPLMGGFVVSLVAEVATAALGCPSAGEPRRPLA